MSSQHLDEAALRPFLRGSFGHPYLFERTCGSTQDLLRRSGLPAGAVAVTEHQGAGRGRSGRQWEDTPGASILVSVLLRPPPEHPSAQLSLVSALAVAETVEAATGLDARVKWPNDVLLRDRKVAGILLEGDGDAVVVGIGVNVDQAEDELPVDTRIPAGSLRAISGHRHERAPLLASLLTHLEERYDVWRAGGLESVAAALEARNWLLGRRIDTEGRAGVAGAIRADGLLEVRLDNGETIAVGSGEILLP